MQRKSNLEMQRNWRNKNPGYMRRYMWARRNEEQIERYTELVEKGMIKARDIKEEFLFNNKDMKYINKLEKIQEIDKI